MNSPASPSDFADWLSRTARGLGYTSDIQLARALGIQPSTISRWRTKGLRPSVEHLLRISKLFGINIVPLLALAGHVPPEAVADSEVPEPPSPVTETVRRIEDAQLDDLYKKILLAYWDRRLEEERNRVYAMIDLFESWQAKQKRPDAGTRALKLLDTRLPAHVQQAFEELVGALDRDIAERQAAIDRATNRGGGS